MNSCFLPHKSSATNSREVLVKNGIIESVEGSNRILKLGDFQRLSEKFNKSARVDYGVTTPLYNIEKKGNNYYLDPNRLAFDQIDAKRKELGIYDTKESIGSYNTRTFKPGETMSQKPGTESSIASPKTIATIKDFLKRIGVDIKTTGEIIVNGVKMNDNAIAQVTQKLIQVIDGKEDRSLPEEAMHFAVEIIKQTNPALFNQLLKEIGSYNMYKDILADYGTDPRYLGKDGKPNILKLKMEAISKVLAEVVIRNEEGYTEKPELLAKVEVWWERILNALKSLFMKSGFDKAAMDIVSGKNIGTADDIRAAAGEIYAQKTGDKQLDLFNKFKEEAARITPIDAKDGGGYKRDNKIVKWRPSDFTKKYYSKKFGNMSKSEFDESINNVKAETGTALHFDLHWMLDNVFTDPETGFLREEEGDDTDYVSQFDPEHRDIYDTLKANLRERLHLLNKNAEGKTRFLSETMVYDPKYGTGDIAGTIDFIAIRPNGKVSLLDWKFMDLDLEKDLDVPWYKVAAWRIQMDTYKNMLKKAYGIDAKDFEQTRMIPIKAYYTESSKKDNILPKVKSIEIGDVDVRKITEDYLIPVGLESETTGSRKLDELLKKLNTDYDVLTAKVAIDPTAKAEKREQVNALFTAIRKLQMQKDIEPLLAQAKILTHYVQQSIDRYSNDWVGTDPMSYTDTQLSEFAIELSNYDSSLVTYLSLDIALKEFFKGELTEDQKELRSEIKEVVDEARSLKDDLERTQSEFIKEFIAKREGVEDVDSAEKVQKGLARIFSSTALIQNRAIQAFFKKGDRALTKAAQDTMDQALELKKIQEAYVKKAITEGISKKNYFDWIKKKNSNELVDEFDKDFYSELKDKIKEKDIDWIKANVNQDEVKVLLEERLKKEIDLIENRTHLTDDEKERLISFKEREYNTDSVKGLGWLQYDIVKKSPVRDIWESKEYKELKKNEPAKALYDYIIKRNEEYRTIGYLSKEDAARTFLPWVRKGMSEKLLFDGKMDIAESFLNSISIDSEDSGFGKYDPRTGNPVNSVPIYFTSKLEEGDYSLDLFKNMAIYNQMAIKFKYMTEIEGQALALLALERNKQAINTSWMGKTKYDEKGNLEYIKDNSKNAKLLENMISAIVYGQKYIQDENFDIALGKIGEKVNNALGMKIFPENVAGKQVSFNKLVSGLNGYFSSKTLGFSFLAPFSNLLGGSFQSVINAGTYMTKTDVTSAQAFMASKGLQKEEDNKKFAAAMQYFLPLTEDANREMARQMSILDFSQEKFQNALFWLMKKSDHYVQATNFKAYIDNAVVVNDKLVNAREYLRTTPEYEDMFVGTLDEIAARKEKFEKDVKQLIKDSGVLNISKIEDGKLIIPGIDRKSDDVINMRAAIQQINSNALGALPESQKRLLNMSIFGDSASMFKGWIPRLVDVRFGGLKYNSASNAWEYGRMRTFGREIFNRQMFSINNLVAAFNGDMTESNLALRREIYDKMKTEYERETGKKFTMTESQFIEMETANLKNALLDVLMTSLSLAAFFALKAAAPDDDEDIRVRNTYKFALRATDKFTDELFYFYDPRNISALIGSGFFPAIKLVTDFQKFITNFFKYNYGIITGADDGELENIYFVKYLMKEFPGTNQVSQYLPMFAPDVAKSIGIQQQSQQGFFR
jgi:hypothetical protein